MNTHHHRSGAKEASASRSASPAFRLLSSAGTMALPYEAALAEAASAGCTLLSARRLVCALTDGALATHLSEFSKNVQDGGWQLLKAGFWSGSLALYEAPGEPFKSELSCNHGAIIVSAEIPARFRGLRGVALAIDAPDFTLECSGAQIRAVFNKEPAIIEGFQGEQVGYYYPHEVAGLPCGARHERTDSGSIPSGTIFSLRAGGAMIVPPVVIAEYKSPIAALCGANPRPSRVSMELGAILSRTYGEYGAIAESVRLAPSA